MYEYFSHYTLSLVLPLLACTRKLAFQQGGRKLREGLFTHGAPQKNSEQANRCGNV